MLETGGETTAGDDGLGGAPGDEAGEEANGGEEEDDKARV